MSQLHTHVALLLGAKTWHTYYEKIFKIFYLILQKVKSKQEVNQDRDLEDTIKVLVHLTDSMNYSMGGEIMNFLNEISQDHLHPNTSIYKINQLEKKIATNSVSSKNDSNATNLGKT